MRGPQRGRDLGGHHARRVAVERLHHRLVRRVGARSGAPRCGWSAGARPRSAMMPGQLGQRRRPVGRAADRRRERRDQRLERVAVLLPVAVHFEEGLDLEQALDPAVLRGAAVAAEQPLVHRDALLGAGLEDRAQGRVRAARRGSRPATARAGARRRCSPGRPGRSARASSSRTAAGARPARAWPRAGAGAAPRRRRRSRRRGARRAAPCATRRGVRRTPCSRVATISARDWPWYLRQKRSR